jgi:hypothetical protein
MEKVVGFLLFLAFAYGAYVLYTKYKNKDSNVPGGESPSEENPNPDRDRQ